MTTHEEFADDIDNAAATSLEVDSAADVAIDKALATMRQGADMLASGAAALHTARLAKNRQANIIRADLTDTAARLRDLP